MLKQIILDKDVLKAALVTAATVVVAGVKLALEARREAQNES